MSKELIEAAILAMRSSALEQYSIIKDILRRPTQESDAERLSAHILKLAQFENGMVTLQQYSATLLQQTAPPPTVVEAEEEPEEESPTDEHAPAESIVITPERSPTLRRSLQHQSTSQPEDDES